MRFQTLSVVVPTGRCVNSCPFCVSKMHESEYKEIISDTGREAYFKQYKKRLQFAQDNGSNTMVFTGTAEPLQNRPFLQKVAEINESIRKPFQWIEIQTTGVYLLAYAGSQFESCVNDLNIDFLKNTVGISTIALSVVDPFDNKNNMKTMNVLPKLQFSLEELIAEIKHRGLNIRLCVNLTQKLAPEHRNFESLINRARYLGADQLTLRQMYYSDTFSTKEDLWVRENSLSKMSFSKMSYPQLEDMRKLESLPTGAKRYSYNGISIVYDDDCMSYAPAEVVRYLILQSNAKLYTKWDDPASLVF